MIEQLMVKDYILFDRAFIDFNKDMSVITGETGAGKSLLIDALSYLSGNRITGNIVRHGKEKAILQMVLSRPNPEVIAMLEDNGFEIEDNLIIQRTVTSQGKSTIRINQQASTLGFVRSLMAKLIDVHSQMDTIQLMDPAVQLDLLDQYAKNATLKEEVQTRYKSYSAAKRALSKAQNETFSDEELESLTNELNAITAANVQENELAELQEKIRQLSRAQQNLDEMGECISMLTKDNGILDSVYETYKIMRKNEQLESESESLHSIYYSLQDISETIKDKREEIFNAHEDLDALQEREYEIKKLYRKYGGSYSQMMERAKEFEERIDRIIHRQDVFEKLEKQLQTSEESYFQAARALSKSRKAVFDALSQEIETHCRDLMLENARFQVEDHEKKPAADGIDEIEFVVSMNPGQPFSPLKRSASGGELSRLMLALKTVFQTQEGIDTIVFDEIDTGVSGKVALAMGSKMYSLSKSHQVLCITHLSSVAVWADSHYYVSKSQNEQETTTSIRQLDEEESLKELAIMASGSAKESAVESMRELRKEVRHG
ncbi:DNA repair protein RecN [uncultured Dubosiella sp.]|mgnify:FL=1|uniref:DNA repair protein RecN n=1 Tax=uncultured Dubosiella sp. TaxID=1937011 RepID=UPI002594DDBA|nr:DNA repair protein RecN [uncultured Dubosiella sp.]